MTPYKPRARKPSIKFRMTSQLSATVSRALLPHIDATGNKRAHVLREALAEYAHKHKLIAATKVPAEFAPTDDPDSRIDVITTIPDQALRDTYESRAKYLGLNSSELLRRCLYLHLKESIAKPPLILGIL